MIFNKMVFGKIAYIRIKIFFVPSVDKSLLMVLSTWHTAGPRLLLIPKISLNFFQVNEYNNSQKSQKEEKFH